MKRILATGAIVALAVFGVAGTANAAPSDAACFGQVHKTINTEGALGFTNVGDVVFEPFSGSGSQLIAAERTGRRCRAIEISPPFVDVAIRRWQKATGQEATLDDDGRTFNEIAVERGLTA